MDMMADERDFKAGDTEILKDKLLSRKDNSVWQVILKHRDMTLSQEKPVSTDVVSHKAPEGEITCLPQGIHQFVWQLVLLNREGMALSFSG